MAIQWYGEQRRLEIEQEMERRINAAVRKVLNQARRLLSVPGTTQAIRAFSYSYGGERFNVRKKGKVYGSVVSAPGEPPRKQFGHLRRSVATEVEGMVGRVGTNLEYGRHLELGTSKMAPRPWLRRALAEMQSEIMALLGRPIR